MSNTTQTIFNKRQGVLLLLGFSSGLPLALVTSTLQAWFTVEGVDLAYLGLLVAITSQPYVYKFLWSPLFDYCQFPFLSRRRDWMLVLQAALLLGILSMSLFSVESHPIALTAVALFVAVLSASQDVVIDAYRVDILPKAERGIGAAVSIAGYRVAMLCSGGLALILADHYGWAVTYQLMAVGMLVGMFATFWATSVSEEQHPECHGFMDLSKPLTDYFRQHRALTFLWLIVLFKLGEVFTSASGLMTNVFLLKELQISLTMVGELNKVVGLLSVLAGVFFGGLILTRWRLFHALWCFGWLQAVTNLGYLYLAVTGYHYGWLVMTVVFDNISAGMGNVAIVAFIMGLCNPRYSATQFAFLSAVAVSTKLIVGPLAGWFIVAFGWPVFFTGTFLLALPGLALIWVLRHEKRLDNYHTPAAVEEDLICD